MNLRVGHFGACLQEVEVASLVGLQHVLRMEPSIAARIGGRLTDDEADTLARLLSRLRSAQ